MRTYLALFAEAFLLAYVLTPLAIKLFERWGLVDRPDGIRKLHPAPVPRLGGAVIVLSAVVTLLSLWMVPNRLGDILRADLPTILGFFGPACLILATGIFDDIRSLPAPAKLGMQILAASLVWLQGIYITLPYLDFSVGHSLSKPLSYLFTVLWIVAITNAMNLIDGLDGLAAGVAFLASTTMVVSGIAFDTPAVAVLMLPLSGALLGFLRYNFNPARIFLGDSGSTFLGFILAVVALVYTQKKATLIAITLPFIALGLPIVELCLSTLRRLIRGRRIFESDYGHVHHRLLNLGLAPRDAVMVLYGVSLLFAVIALISIIVTRFAGAIIITAFCAMVILGVHILRYPEFQELGASLGMFSPRIVRKQIVLRELCEELQCATSFGQVVSIVERVAVLFGLSGFRLNLSDQLAPLLNNDHRVFAKDFKHSTDHFNHSEASWLLLIPYGSNRADTSGDDSLCLYRGRGDNAEYLPIDALVNSLAPALRLAFQRLSRAASLNLSRNG